MKFLIIICFILISPITKAGPGGRGSNPTMMTQSNFGNFELENIDSNSETSLNNVKKIELNNSATFKELAQKLLDNNLISNDSYNNMLKNENSINLDN